MKVRLVYLKLTPLRLSMLYCRKWVGREAKIQNQETHQKTEIGLEARESMCNILLMTVISVSIAEGRTDLCQLIKKVESGTKVILTAYGKPKAVLSPYREQGSPWRVEIPDDPSRYGDLQSPVLEDWE